MKKILYIFLTLSILLIGCSKEDDVQITQQVPNLDQNLYGEWNDGSYDLSLSSNGKFVYWYENNTGNSGEWWVQDGYLLLDYTGSGSGTGSSYSVNGNELYFRGNYWYKN